MNTYEIKDKVFLVTGGAGGIGAGFVRSVLAQGAKHVAIFDIDLAGESLQNELNETYGKDRVRFYKVDVTNEIEIDTAFDDVVQSFGHIDALLNSAGIFNDSEKMFKKSIQINVVALVNMSLKLYKHMRQDRGGRGGTIINIASIGALIQYNHSSIYCATKSAVLQFSNCIGHIKNYNRTGVRVLAMCLGATGTTLFSDIKFSLFDEESEQDFKDLVASGLSMQKEESAVNGLVEAYKRGGPGTTWAAVNDQPAVDYTPQVNKAYEILSEIVV